MKKFGSFSEEVKESMIKEKNNDQIFRDKLENFSVEPPAHIWTGIQDQLAMRRRNRRIIAIRWFSAAAAILLAFLGGWYFNHSVKTPQSATIEKSIVQPNNTPLKENDIPETNKNTPVAPDHNLVAGSVKAKQTETEKQTTVSKAPGKQTVLVPSSQGEKKKSLIWQLLEGREPDLILSQKTENNSLKTKHVFVTELTNADRALIASNSIGPRTENQDESRWKLGMMVSPGYSSQVTSHSESYASNMTRSASIGNVDVTGGISVRVRTGKRWSIESGVYYDQNGQKSQSSFHLFESYADVNSPYAEADRNYYANNIKVMNGTINMNSTAGVIAMDKTPKGTEVSGNVDAAFSGTSNQLVTSGDFSQVFDFIEVPLYLRYKLIDSRVDVEMMGGFNAGLLVGNNAYIDNEFGIQNIGKTQDVSSLNVSGTIGIGLNYQLGRHFSLGVEPRFNYFLSSINNNPDVNFKPYRFGFYTGVYYEF